MKTRSEGYDVFSSCSCFNLFRITLTCFTLFALRLLCLACWKGKLPHVTVCFVWFCFHFALFVGGNCYMARFALFVRGRGKLSHVAACFVCFVLLVRGGNCHMLRFSLHCFASLRFAFLCFALHCIVHLWNDEKKQKTCYKAW